MKVAFDSQIFLQQRYGGISRYFCELATATHKQQDIQIKIFAPMYINAYLPVLDRHLLTGYPITSWTRFTKIQASAAKWYESMSMRLYQPQIIHETYYAPCPPHLPSALRILTIYDMIHELMPESFPKDDSTARDKAAAAARADHVICISESTRRDAIRLLGLSPDKISVTHLSASVLAPNADLALGADTGTTHHPKPYMLYVGLRGGYKNFQGLLEAYAASPLLQTVDLVCFGGSPFSSKELASFEHRGLSLSSLRQVSGDDAALAVYYRHAVVFVYPSRYEGFGIPPLEAMAQQCPVACSNTSSIPEVVGDAGEYFDPSDPHSIRLALEHLIQHPERRAELVHKGRQRAATFSWQRCARETIDIYKMALGVQLDP